MKIACGKCNGSGRYGNCGVCFACGGTGRGRIAKSSPVTSAKALATLRAIYAANRTVAAQEVESYLRFADATTFNHAVKAILAIDSDTAEKVIAAFATLPGAGPSFAADMRFYRAA